MKILFCGDSPSVSTGFSRCTVAACDELHRAGHEVHILGINEFGDPSLYHSPIYPCVQPLDHGHDLFGVSRLPILMQRLEPDTVILLNDPWNVKAYIESIQRWWMPDEPPAIPIVAWLAVDAKNQPGHELNDLAHVIVWTEFAAKELRSGGYKGPLSITPLGVDRSIFYPRDQKEARKKVCPDGLPHDAFIVGVVGRNQPRKRLDLVIQYFAEWVSLYNIAANTWLYLHVAPTGDKGCDIRNLVKYYGLEGRVLLAEPDIGKGDDNDHVANVYSAFDIMLTTTQGEGWGLPILEAMSCGVPCIVPDWSGLGSWVEDAALRVNCSSTAMSAPLNSLAYTIGGVPSKVATMEALSVLYGSAAVAEKLCQLGIDLASRLTWQKTGEMFRQVIENVVQESKEKAA